MRLVQLAEKASQIQNLRKKRYTWISKLTTTIEVIRWKNRIRRKSVTITVVINTTCANMEGLSEQALSQVAQYFSALAEPSRLRILNYLREGEKNVGELAEACACSQANVSRHLSTLAKHGLVAREGRGTSVYYRIADPGIYTLCDLVCGNVARQLENQALLLNSLAPKNK